MPARRAISIPLSLLTVVAASGCVMVGRAAPLASAPAPPAAPPAIEYAWEDFTFQMNEREPTRSHFDARQIIAEIVDVWERRDYVSAAEHVDADAFSPDAAYHVTFGGSVHAETSFWAQLLNALTLMVVPYSVTNRYELRVAVQSAGGGAPVVATARSADKIWIGLLLVPALPFVERGHDEEMGRLADELYAQVAAQGALITEPDEGRKTKDEGSASEE